MGSWREDVIAALQNLGGSAPLERIYDEVSRIRSQSRSVGFDASVRGTIEIASPDSAKFDGKNNVFFSCLGRGRGIWGLNSYIHLTPVAADIEDVVEPNEGPLGRVEQTTYRILRDTVLARRIKSIYNYECQICAKSIMLPNGCFYAEAHHIRPVGAPHNGPDSSDNIMVLCPTCHVLMDYGVERIGDDVICKEGHVINPEHIKYHNEHIWRKIE